MAKTLAFLLALAVCGSAAHAAEQAAPAPTGDELTVTHPHDYWLSDGLNRLAFWQTPGLQTGRSVAKSPR